MKKIIITAGGTSEKIDNVRKITNSSSGKLGMTIANHLLQENKNILIYYICSKNSLRPFDNRIKIIEIDGTIDLKNKVEKLLVNEHIDYFIHSMAVSDYMTDYVTTIEKIKESIRKSDNIDEAFSNIEIVGGSKISSYESNLVIMLKPTPKIISIIKTLSPSTYLVGFKLLDGVSKEELIDVAKKLRDKNRCDLVVANDLSTIRNGEHIAYIIDKDDVIEESHGKNDIAKKLIRKMFNDDIYYKTIIKNSNININEQDLNIYHTYINKFKGKLTEKIYNDKYYFGCVAVKTNKGFITTIRGKQNLDEYTVIENVDHKNHIVNAINKKATLNAPLLDYLFKNKNVKTIVHLHDFDDNLPYYDYAFPGTARDSIRDNVTSFNIKYHGVIYMFDKKGNIL